LKARIFSSSAENALAYNNASVAIVISEVVGLDGKKWSTIWAMSHRHDSCDVNK
jgi:hypothetical protein